MKENVIVVFGGCSAEHDVSVVTAVTFLKRYFCNDYNLIPVYITKDNRWFTGVDLCNFSFYRKFDEKKLTLVTLIPNSNVLYKFFKNKVKELYKIDCIVNCCHGGAGENGDLASLFTLCGIPSTTGPGCGMGIAMNKVLSKYFFSAKDAPIVDFFYVDKKDWLENRIDILRQVANFDFPIIVKPISQGSSIGVAFANNFEMFEKAINFAYKFDNSVIVERAIENKREFNCCVMRTSKEVVVSEIDEPITEKIVVSFQDKYFAGRSTAKAGKGVELFNATNANMENSKRKFPADISKDLRKRIQKISLELYNSLYLNGVVRIDFMYDTKKNKLFVGEINTIPGSLGYYFFETKDFVINLIEGAKSFWKDNRVALPSNEYRIFN